MEKQEVQVKQLKNDLNEKELKSFNELKEKILQESKIFLKDRNEEDIYRYTEDNQVVRVLLAREFKVEKSLEMWKKWVEWRISFSADDIKEEDIEGELKSGKAFWHGFDNHGNPCLVVKIKFHRPGVSSQDVILKFFLYLLEQGIRKSEEAGTGKICVIWDRDGFERKNFDTALFNTFKKLNQIIQDNYAERLASIYIVHPNWVFKAIYLLVKPFLTERTRKKINVMNKLPDLLKHFESTQLLKEYGGNSTFVYEYRVEHQKIQEQPIMESFKSAQNTNQNELVQNNANDSQQCKEESIAEECLLGQEDKATLNNLQLKNYDMSELSGSMFAKQFDQQS